MLSGTSKGLKRKKSPPLYRSMSFYEKSTKRTLEEDAVVRFFAMLNVLVPHKGRSVYKITDTTIWELKIQQPLEAAFYKMFQAMLAYPSNRPLSDLVYFTCHDVLHDEVEKLKIKLGLQAIPLQGNTAMSAAYLKKAKEARMKIHEDTLMRFYTMLELYVPLKMRPKLWDEQILSDDYWEKQLKAPIREAFHEFICVMQCFPTEVIMQKHLVDYSINTVLPNSETAMKLRGIRFELTSHRSLSKDRSAIKPEAREDDVKLAYRFHAEALRYPSTSPESSRAMKTYERLVKSASSAQQHCAAENQNPQVWQKSHLLGVSGLDGSELQRRTVLQSRSQKATTTLTKRPASAGDVAMTKVLTNSCTGQQKRGKSASEATSEQALDISLSNIFSDNMLNDRIRHTGFCTFNTKESFNNQLSATTDQMLFVPRRVTRRPFVHCNKPGNVVVKERWNY